MNIQMQFDDLPALVDIDGRTDLDILNVRFTGNGSIEFHKNVIVKKQNIIDPAVNQIAKIVRGADTDRFDIAPQA